MAWDVDDVGAVCVAHALEKRGLVDIRGIVYNTGIKYGIGAVSLLNHYFNRGEIPVGAYKDQFMDKKDPGYFVNEIVRDFSYLIEGETGVKSKDEAKVKSATETYREILEKAENNSIVIASIGFTINLKDLLESKPDEISEMSGLQLVEKKVKHLSLMGGAYPDSKNGKHPEFNFAFVGGKDGKIAVEATRYVMENWPKSVPIIFNGYEIGANIWTGAKMIDKNAEKKNPCAKAYKYFCDAREGNCKEKGRESWDLVTVLHAVFLEDEEAWAKLLKSSTNVEKVAESLHSKENDWQNRYNPWKRISGVNDVDERGHNSFKEKENVQMFYLKIDDESRNLAFEHILDDLLLEAHEKGTVVVKNVLNNLAEANEGDQTLVVVEHDQQKKFCCEVQDQKI